MPQITRSSLSGRKPSRSRKWRASTVRCLLLATTLFALALWATLALFGLDPAESDADDAVAANGAIAGAIDGGGGVAPPPRATIAYAVSLTSCGVTSDRHDNVRNGGHSSDPSFHEGAAVLKHSIHLSSVRNYPRSRSVFDYEMIAFVHPDAESCSSVFRDLGYDVQVRETPFNVTDIRGEFLREHIARSGCCGEKEYLKLYAYALSEFPIVVHLDLDSLVLRPMDDLFHAMLGEAGASGAAAGARSRVAAMHDDPLPKGPIDAYFTRDYNMINPGHKHVGVQGGFLVVRPDADAFREYVDIVLEGRFHQGSGWEGRGYGGYFGAQQIQGVCSFYYDHRHPGTAVELNKCYYNAMADGPRAPSKKCRDGRAECQDCREVPLGDVKSVHFTLCSKPWQCPTKAGARDDVNGICAKFHGEWFRIREDLDRDRAMREGVGYSNPGGKHKPEVFRGYCKSNGERGYIPIGGS